MPKPDDYLALREVERKLEDLAPDLDEKPFSERTERDGEIANLLGGVRGRQAELLDGEEVEAEIIEELRSRTQMLIDHPDWAGKHSEMADTIPCGPPTLLPGDIENDTDIPDEIA